MTDIRLQEYSVHAAWWDGETRDFCVWARHDAAAIVAGLHAPASTGAAYLSVKLDGALTGHVKMHRAAATEGARETEPRLAQSLDAHLMYMLTVTEGEVHATVRAIREALHERARAVGLDV